jgi:hypothetical protein
MIAPEALEGILAHATGTEQWYKHWTGPVFYTDGAKVMAEQAQAFWLIDIIAIQQKYGKVKLADSQEWILRKDAKGAGALLVCKDERGMEILRQTLEYTDFPLYPRGEFTVWVEGLQGERIILLPSEH